MPQETDPSSELPKLADALRHAYGHAPEIPSDIDHRIAALAHERFAQQQRRRMTIRWAAAAAAGLAAVLVLAVVLHRPQSPALVASKSTPNSVNMVDALLLARHLAAHDALDPSSDINHDGVVDQKDVDAIATAAVRLTPAKLARRLPTLQNLGLNKRVASASTDVLLSPKTIAQLTPKPREDCR